MTIMSKPRFDPEDPDHIVSLAVMLDSILNSRRGDVRFALVIWQDQHDDLQGTISNETSEETVLERLDEAKKKIHEAEVHGHA